MSENQPNPEHEPIRRLTWSERPTRELVRLSGPIAVSMLSYSLMTLADTIFVGRLGSSALAGVGLGGITSFTVTCFALGFLRAIKIVGSQAEGAGDSRALREAGATGMAYAWLLGGVVLILGQLVALTLPWIAATVESGSAARSYMQVRMLGGPIVLSFVALREHRYARGDSMMPTYASLTGNAINIGLDVVFILGFGWGAAGAAAATVVGQAVELAVLGARDVGFRPSDFSRSMFRKLFELGWPTGVQFLLEVGAFSVLTAMLAALDENEMAAHQVAIQVMHFAFLPGFAVSEATSVLAGQAIGGKRPLLVRAAASRGMMLASAWAAISTLVLIGFGDGIAAAFGVDEELASVLRRLLFIAAFFQFADAANMIARGVLRGIGDVRFAAVLGIGTAWIFTPPLTYLLGYRYELGAFGGWLALTAEIVVGAAVLWLRLATVLRRPDMRNEVVTPEVGLVAT